MSFESIIAEYRENSVSLAQQGHRFERLMQAFLATAPLFEDRQFQKLWLWSDFPLRAQFGNGHDVGIDIVGHTKDDRYIAVQCKCQQRDARIDKPAVDSFLATSLKRFLDEKGGEHGFSELIFLSTSGQWSANAEAAIEGLATPFTRLDLEELASQADVDWDALDAGLSGEAARAPRMSPRPHQVEAIEACHAHFAAHDRGKLIMACGTGKTFTALKIAERELEGAPHRGAVLFLVPSIALLNQTLIAWKAQSAAPFDAICVCSDGEAGKQNLGGEDDVCVRKEELALPPSTNAASVAHQFEHALAHGIGRWTAVFSTYQSIEVVAAAQKLLSEDKHLDATFDLVICDEAHRTTGVAFRSTAKIIQPTLLTDAPKKRGRPKKSSIISSGYDESAFTRVHDDGFLRAKKRLYMTATPRLYKDEAKQQARDADALLCSMDDPALYGEEIFRVSFARAVNDKLLSDYRVLVLTVRESELPPEVFQNLKSVQTGDDGDAQTEIKADDLTKLVGCLNALSKRALSDEDGLTEVRRFDVNPMRSAIAFCQTINVSKSTTRRFNACQAAYRETLGEAARAETVTLAARHVDGTMSATDRRAALRWLESVDPDGMESRVLTNVRCLSEGVDVPALDAVLFLSPRSSEVDVVQSVGRVMRTAPGKRYGYIIIPVVIPEHREPEEILGGADSPFRVVWQVLRALRSHDERLPGEINKIGLNGGSRQIVVSAPLNDAIGKGDGTIRKGGISLGEKTPPYETSVQQELRLRFENLRGGIYGRLVKKVGSRTYWEDWAGDVGKEALRQIERIKKLVERCDNVVNPPPPATHFTTNTFMHSMNS